MRSLATAAALSALLLFARCTAVHGENEAVVARESQLKAAYIFNFLKLVEWPATAAGPELVVCVRGASRVHDALQANLANKKVGARPIALRALGQDEPADDCHALYVDGELPQGGKLMAPSETALPLLTISDAEGFAERDGIIELFTDNNRLRFNINVHNARRVGLRISANLLQLAAAVKQ